LWIGRRVCERSVKLVGSFEVGLKLALNVIELLLVLKMGCHVIQVRNLVTKFVQEVVLLLLVNVAITTWLIAWITWVLFISITRVRLSWSNVTIMNVLANNANVLLNLLFVELIDWVIAIITAATSFTFDDVWATK
jgi:hypothetical protein